MISPDVDRADMDAFENQRFAKDSEYVADLLELRENGKYFTPLQINKKLYDAGSRIYRARQVIRMERHDRREAKVYAALSSVWRTAKRASLVIYWATIIGACLFFGGWMIALGRGWL